MSFAEDNDLDCWFLEDFGDDLEDLWKKGKHITRDGRKIKIKKMENQHLQNTIKYFNKLGYDTSLLMKEIKRRTTIK